MSGGREITLLYDGACGLCTGSVAFVRRRDHHGKIRCVAAQSDEGAALQREHGVEVLGAHTLVVIADGRTHLRSDAALRVARELDRPWPLLGALRVVPRVLRDRVYAFVAKRRR